MNPRQLATKEESLKIVAMLGNIGGGVKELYIPQFQGPYSAPEFGDSKFYHVDFYNGSTGHNIGLIRTTMEFFPTRWVLMVATEVEETKSQTTALLSGSDDPDSPDNNSTSITFPKPTPATQSTTTSTKASN